mgnify:CR=1 FL=1
MSRRNWLPYAALGIGCLLVTAAILIAAILTQPGHQDRDATRHQANPAEAVDHTAGEGQPPPFVTSQDYIGRIARALEAANTKDKPDEERRRETDDLKAQQEMSHWAMWMFFATLGSVVLTAGGVFLIGRTLVYTKRTLDEATKTTVAAKDAVAVTRHIGQVQTCAYVLANGGNCKINSDGKLDITIILKNCGQTPAHDMVHSIGCTMLASDATISFDPWADELNRSKSYIGAGAEHHAGMIRELNEFEGAALKEGKAQVVVWGRVEYTDIFRRPRWASFVFLSNERVGSVLGQIAWSIGACEVGTEADTDEADDSRTPKPRSRNITLTRRAPSKPEQLDTSLGIDANTLKNT